MDSSLSPALWVGTSLGTVLAISINMPPSGEQRLLQPVIVSPSGEFILLYILICRHVSSSKSENYFSYFSSQLYFVKNHLTNDKPKYGSTSVNNLDNHWCTSWKWIPVNYPTYIVYPGTFIKLKGSIVRMAFLDGSGSLLPPASEPWYEANTDSEEKERVRRKRPVSVSPSTSQDLNESQYMVVCSEKQAKVISLPSQTCIFKHNITETSFVLRADVVHVGAGICVACFCANGHIMTLRYPVLETRLLFHQ